MTGVPPIPPQPAEGRSGSSATSFLNIPTAGTPMSSRSVGMGWRAAVRQHRWAHTPSAGRFFGIAVAVGLLGVWQGLAELPGADFLVAGPIAVISWLASNSGLAARALSVTLQAAALGFLWGNLSAVALALLSLTLPRIERLVSALALLMFCLPLVATGPILRVLYGPGFGPQITISALAVSFTTYLALMVGLRAAPSSWFDLIRSYGRGRVSELLRVRSHAALPYLIAGLQIAAPASVLGALVGEFTGADRGLGVLTIRAIRALDVPATWSLATLAAGVSILMYLALARLGAWLSVAPVATLLAPLPETGPAPRWHAPLRWSVTVLVVLLLWQGMMDVFHLNIFFAKRPADVWHFLFAAPEAAANRATLLHAYAQTMVLTLPGYLAGLILGAGVAVVVVLRPGLGHALLTLSIALRSIPIVTTAPLIVLALGRGATGTITTVAVLIFFPTLVACLSGMRQSPGQVQDVFASYAASRGQRLWLAQVPAMLPAFFASARMAVPAAILAATTTEWLATGIGMGSLMAMTASTSAYGMLWSTIVLMSLTAAMGYVAVETVERAVLRIYGPEQLAR